MNNDPSAYTPRTSSSTTVINLLYALYQNPVAFLTMFMSLVTGKMAKDGWVVPDAQTLFNYFVFFLFAVGCVSFLIWALPKSLHIFVNATVCAFFSLMTMSWCMNNADDCKGYFVVTSERINNFIFVCQRFFFEMMPW